MTQTDLSPVFEVDRDLPVPHPPALACDRRGWLVLLLGLGMAAGGAYLLVRHAFCGMADAALGAGLFGLGAGMTFGGYSAATGGNPWLSGILAALVMSALGVGAGPSVSRQYYVGLEQRAFEECRAAAHAAQWDRQYFGFERGVSKGGLAGIPTPFRRTEAYVEAFRLYVEETIEHGGVVNIRHRRAQANWLAANPRPSSRELDTWSFPDYFFDAMPSPGYEEIEQRCVRTIYGFYELALRKMAAPAVADARNEFPVDEDLRAAFVKVLKDMATADSPVVYVRFVSSANIDKPAGADEELADLILRDDLLAAAKPSVREVVGPHDAFSRSYDAARRQSCMEALRRAFSAVFSADLLTLELLADDKDGKGNLVLDISASVLRRPDYYVMTQSVKTFGLRGRDVATGVLFGISVDWSFTVRDRQGRSIFSVEEVSDPASSVRFTTLESDPDWAVYSILMDSAYHNYSRKLIGAFGLVPPEEKQEWTYSAPIVRGSGLSGGIFEPRNLPSYLPYVNSSFPKRKKG